MTMMPISENTAKQLTYFQNRLEKNKAHLLRWAKKNNVGAFCAYDKDIPEIPLNVTVYYEMKPHGKRDGYQSGDYTDYVKPYIVLTLYKRPYEKDIAEEQAWLDVMKSAAIKCFETDAGRVITKLRKRRKDGVNDIVPKALRSQITLVVQEGLAKFFIYLGSLLDMGLFLDHRYLRRRIFNEAAGKQVLNLFCYTGSFSVFAQLGGAASVTSVDLSKNYLQRAKDNFTLNGLDPSKSFFIESDVLRFLQTSIRQKNKTWDIIICDAPTFSNSKKTTTVLDINADWKNLCTLCLQLLTENGTLYFSCNSKSSKINNDSIRTFQTELKAKLRTDFFIKDISDSSLDPDFQRKKPHTLLVFRRMRG